MAKPASYPRTQTPLLTALLAGDALFCFFGLSIGYWLRFSTALRNVGVEAGANTTYTNYLPLLGLGTVFFIVAYAYLNLYDARALLRPNRALSIIFRGVLFWFAAFLGTSLVLKFEPPISRLFVAISCLTTLATMVVWRKLFQRFISRSSFRDRITQRILLIGWTTEAAQIADAVAIDENHPYTIVGLVETPSAQTPVGRAVRYPVLGHIDQLEELFTEHRVDLVVVADVNLAKERLMAIAAQSERRYIAFKVIPSFFQIFVSNLHLQTISSVPILGVEELPIRALVNHYLKRIVDIAGALVGLILSAPVIGVLSIFIRRESAGSVFYGQTRTGLHGKPFRMYKLRSMRTDAEVDTGALWAVKNDPRRTKIGRFMRENNLDELPQFWNVLKGDMSLVGPRPERPELIAKFEFEIPHYNPRHEVRPGLTGWAQVNGLRGNTSLVERIKYDLFYIENWSLWFDLQIIVLTFIRRHNAY